MEQERDIHEVIELIADISSLQAEVLNETREQALNELADLVT